ncbi:TPA: hypothetical protein ACU3BL_001894 [Salmonella enterica]
MKYFCIILSQLLCFFQTASACELIELPVSGRYALLHNQKIDLGEPDDINYPEHWLGPVSFIMESGKKCSINIDLVQKPVSSGGNKLFISTYSGSIFVLYSIDTQNCSISWQSKVYSSETIFEHGTLKIAGKKIPLDKECNVIEKYSNK